MMFTSGGEISAKLLEMDPHNRYQDLENLLEEMKHSKISSKKTMESKIESNWMDHSRSQSVSKNGVLYKEELEKKREYQEISVDNWIEVDELNSSLDDCMVKWKGVEIPKNLMAIPSTPILFEHFKKSNQGTNIYRAPEEPIEQELEPIPPPELPKIELNYYTCAACQGEIQGRCITAMFRKFHPEHFVCSFCLKQLNQGTFKEREDKPFCKTCFNRLFG